MSQVLNIFIQLLLVLLCHQIATSDAEKNRIVGGEPTTINKVPYIVSLRKNGKFFCGGSLVNSSYVVTAAHCVKDLKPSDLQIHAGNTYLNQQGEKRSVAKITIPRAYNNNTKTMDVAVLKLSKPMTGNNIATIPFCSHKLLVGDTVTVSGWGLTNENANDPSQQLRTVNVPMISAQKCQLDYRGKYKLTPTMMCAAVPGKKDSCSGDSGGPLVHKGELCGIVSFGRGCARPNYPGVYTNVIQVQTFINNAMKN